MKVYKDGNVYKVALLDGKYYAYSKVGRVKNSGGVLPDAPVIPDEPDINYGVELVGNLQNNNGILSGFDENSYAVVRYTLPENFTTFEMVVRCTMDNFSIAQGLFCTNFEDWNYGMNLGVSGDVLYAGFTQNSSATCSISGAGVEYWWKYVYDGSTVKAYRKTEGSDYIQLSSIDITTDVKPTNTGSITLGRETALYPDRYNRGTFNLNGDYIKADGVVVWEGVKTS